MRKINRALVSVSDKTGLVEFCQALAAHGVEILSTGGTAKLLRKHDITVIDVSVHTRSPEILDGRVKTLHPRIHGGILYMRSNPDHVRQIEEQGIEPVDLVVCNLYPFEKTVASSGVSFAEAIENIDIGGPSMVRAAAKNHADVTVVVAPSQYERVMQELKENEGSIGPQARFELALEAFRTTAHYDAAISQYLSAVAVDDLPPLLWLEMDSAEVLREGLKPGAGAVLYSGPLGVTGGIADSNFIAGPDSSAEDVVCLDLAALSATSTGHSCVTIVRSGVLDALVIMPDVHDALAGIAERYHSVIGLYIGISEPLDEKMAAFISKSFSFVEGIAAPSLQRGVRKELSANSSWGTRLRIVEYNNPVLDSQRGLKFRPVSGGLIAERVENAESLLDKLVLVSSGEPQAADWVDASLAWSLLQYYRSNAVVLVKDGRLVGYSCCNPDMEEAISSSVRNASKNARGSFAACSSNPDDPEHLTRLYSAGVRGIVLPGKNKQEEMAANLANHHNIVMFVTGRRSVNI